MPFIQCRGNFSAFLSRNRRQKNFTDNWCSYWVNNHLMFFSRSLFIAIRAVCNILPSCHLHVHSSFYFLGKILTILLIDEVTESYIHAAGCTNVICAVIMVIDGNKSNTKKRENMLQKIANL